MHSRARAGTQTQTHAHIPHPTPPPTKMQAILKASSKYCVTSFVPEPHDQSVCALRAAIARPVSDELCTESKGSTLATNKCFTPRRRHRFALAVMTRPPLPHPRSIFRVWACCETSSPSQKPLSSITVCHRMQCQCVGVKRWSSEPECSIRSFLKTPRPAQLAAR